jgi:type IV fimbrial biogenesis protein FimT
MPLLDLSPTAAKAGVRISVQRQPAMLRLRGFTLIETMMVVVIVAILAAVAGPSMVDMYRTTRLSAASSALQVSLNLARSEAIKRGSDARVTVVANGAAGVWTNGWTVFADGTNNANAAVAPTADSGTVTRLEVVAAPTGPLTFSQSAGDNYFIYSGQGRLIDTAGLAVVGRRVWFSNAGSDRFCLIITNTGRVRTMRSPSATACPTD